MSVQRSTVRSRSATGWGYDGEGLAPEEAELVGKLLAARFPHADLTLREPVPRPALPAPRIAVPDALAACCATDDETRWLHARGRSTVDLVALRSGAAVAPDVVSMPRTAAEVTAVLDWCGAAGAACVPFGGGTSVVGGVNPPAGDRPVVTLQLRGLRRVLEVDEVSRAARIEAGATGPGLEEQLRPSGLTLRFFPQSFELSTLGGWIATRAAGHFATRLTHIDDLVESVTAVTPAGTWSSRRLPASGAGPSPDRFLLGSEGTLGVITEAWVRLRPRPQHRAGAALRFADLPSAADAVRRLVQGGIEPANCRVLDPMEALLAGAGDGSAAVLVLAFEHADRPVDDDLAAALEVCGGTVERSGTQRVLGQERSGAQRVLGQERSGAQRVLGQERSGAQRVLGQERSGAQRVLGQEQRRDADPAAAWRRSFLRAPYLRDALLARGVLSETFETAVTWDRLDELVAEVSAAAQRALGDGIVACRLTHAYPDGAAPYFTVIAPARRGAEAQQWAEVKAAATEAVLACGGTVTHHHAVGRDHRPWYDRQRPAPFALALAAAKRTLDPAGVLNPGVLID